MKKPPIQFPNAQRGVVLLLFFLVLFMAGASLFISYANSTVVNQQRKDNAMRALVEAREALIAYAIMHGDYYGAAGAGPGHLPCPDTNGDGQENSPCAINALNRLPITITEPGGAILELSDYGNGFDENLWYAVANEARRAPVSAFNTTTVTTLSADGQANMAAVLIAPGEALLTQTRPSSNDANYLEAGNAGGPNYVSNDPLDPDNFNDLVLGITVEDIMVPVTARIAETIKAQLDVFHTTNGRYPNPVVDPAEFGSAVATAPAWFAANNWDTVSQYARIDDDSATITFTGCPNISYTLDNTAGTIARIGTGC